jgi:hypothetical protein
MHAVRLLAVSSNDAVLYVGLLLLLLLRESEGFLRRLATHTCFFWVARGLHLLACH